MLICYNKGTDDTSDRHPVTTKSRSGPTRYAAVPGPGGAKSAVTFSMICNGRIAALLPGAMPAPLMAMAAFLAQVASATATWRPLLSSARSMHMNEPSQLLPPRSSPILTLSSRHLDMRLRGGSMSTLSSQASRFAKFYGDDSLTDLPMNTSFAMGANGEDYQEQDSACDGELNAWEVGKLQLEACQDIMDDCYDRWIRPCVEELENKIFEGEEEAARRGEFRPYNFFAKEACSIIQKCKIVIDKAVKDLQTRLEVIQFSAVRGGQPVSSIEFEDFNVDLKHVRHLTVESHR
eukprot:762522-Hanusia_phi.AAC.3